MEDRPVTLKSPSEIRILFESGKRAQKFPLSVVFRKNNLNHNRYLYCTDRKVKLAVDRNRIKRVLRAIVKDLHAGNRTGYDIAMITNLKFSNLKYSERIHSASYLFKKIADE
ncbi:MAG: ribonuclease P protein component [Leptospira sp.]|nr:ribonuclease P protein component [Leptospira sp.]